MYIHMEVKFKITFCFYVHDHIKSGIEQCYKYLKISNISHTKSQNLNACWSQVLSGEWRCSWSSADRQLHLSDQPFICQLKCALY